MRKKQMLQTDRISGIGTNQGNDRFMNIRLQNPL